MKTLRIIIYFLYLSKICGIRKVFNVFIYDKWYSDSEILKRKIKLEADFRRICHKNSLPIQGNSIIDKEFLRQLMAGEISHPFMLCKTSGSTGEPFIFYKSAYSFLNSQRTYYNFFKQFGISRFENHIYIGGARQAGKGILFTIKEIGKRKLFGERKFVSADISTDAEYSVIVKAIQYERPKYIAGFTSALIKVSKYILENKIELGYKPVLVHPSAESMTSIDKEIISRAFKAKNIAMVYGSTEGHFASQCTKSQYHINADTCDLRSVNGKLIVTIYDSNDMPFVNYETGDMGEIQDIECECGKKGKIISGIQGRNKDIIKIGTLEFTHADINMLIQNEIQSNSVKSYQLCLDGEYCSVRVEGNKGYAKLIADTLNKRFNTFITASDEDVILEPSGKRLVIKKINRSFEKSSLLTEYTPYLEISSLSDSDLKQEYFKLDWNEGFADVSNLLKINFQKQNYHLYPDLKSEKLIQAASSFYGINEENIESFNGSDSAINCICQALLDPNKSFLIINPTYGNYLATASKYTNKHIKIDLDPHRKISAFDLSVEINKTDAELVFLPNPNNPTGQYFSDSELLKLANDNKDKIFILDQAYQEFVIGSHLINKEYINTPNVIVTRTLSKAFSLAGLRIGFVMCNLDIMHALRMVRDNKQVNGISQIIGKSALESPSYMFDYIKDVALSKAIIIKKLKEESIQYLTGEGNFILIRTNNSAVATDKLKNNLIYVRDRGSLPFLHDYIRLTIPPTNNVEKVLFYLLNAIK